MTLKRTVREILQGIRNEHLGTDPVAAMSAEAWGVQAMQSITEQIALQLPTVLAGKPFTVHIEGFPTLHEAAAAFQMVEDYLAGLPSSLDYLKEPEEWGVDLDSFPNFAAAWMRLPTLQKDCMWLRTQKGLKYWEVAKALGISKNKALRELSKAYATLSIDSRGLEAEAAADAAAVATAAAEAATATIH